MVASTGSASSQHPCPLCHVSLHQLARTCAFGDKGIADMVDAARTPVVAPPRFAAVNVRRLHRARVIAAKNLSVSQLGRAPAPFTRRALAVSSNLDAHLRFRIDHLHMIGGGIVRTLTKNVLLGDSGILPAAAVDELQRRTLELAPMRGGRGGISVVCPVTAAQLQGKMPAVAYTDMLPFLAGITMGLLARPEWVVFASAW